MSTLRYSAHRTVTIASADTADTDGVKASFATSTDPVVVVLAGFDGVLIDDAGYLRPLPRTITISRSDDADAFSEDPIVVRGMRGGTEITESLTPENDDGNDILVTQHAFDRLISVSFPAQGSTAGAFEIGAQDVAAPHGDTFIGVEVDADGNLVVQYGEGANAPTDTLPIPTGQVGAVKPIAPTRILTGASATTIGFRVYLP